LEDVILHRDMILDGRNRYTAATRKGLPVRTSLFKGDDRDALAWVISKNLKRRHLTESQRAMVAARIATLKLGANQHTQAAPIGAPCGLCGCMAACPCACRNGSMISCALTRLSRTKAAASRSEALARCPARAASVVTCARFC
ncbi:hypothetical protein, partial [Pseudomonas sp. RA_15y_Pfl1_P12]